MMPPSKTNSPPSDVTRKQAKKILRILVGQAGSETPPITYGVLSERSGVAVCNLRNPMNHLSRTLAEYAKAQELDIPPLQVLVVNGTTGLPGPGAWQFVGEPLVSAGQAVNDLSAKEQSRVVQTVHAAIASFEEWDAVAAEVAKRL